jgi:hypothetical protein
VSLGYEEDVDVCFGEWAAFGYVGILSSFNDIGPYCSSRQGARRAKIMQCGYGEYQVVGDRLGNVDASCFYLAYNKPRNLQ